MTKIYIAGSSKERPLIRALMAEVRELGYVITYDWDALAPWDRECTNEELSEQAQIDIDAVKAADILWYVAPADGVLSEGAHGELCAAIVLGKTVVASGHLGRHRIFPRLAKYKFAEHEHALQFLRSIVAIDLVKRLRIEALRVRIALYTPDAVPSDLAAELTEALATGDVPCP